MILKPYHLYKYYVSILLIRKIISLGIIDIYYLKITRQVIFYFIV